MPNTINIVPENWCKIGKLPETSSSFLILGWENSLEASTSAESSGYILSIYMTNKFDGGPGKHATANGPIFFLHQFGANMSMELNYRW